MRRAAINRPQAIAYWESTDQSVFIKVVAEVIQRASGLDPGIPGLIGPGTTRGLDLLSARCLDLRPHRYFASASRC